MKRTLRSTFLVFLNLTLCGAALAQAKPKSDQPTLTPTTDLNAIRVSVQNGVIGFVNNARQATLNLEWELLPTDKNLLAEIRENSPDRMTFRFSNRGLRDGSWIKSLNPSQQRFLADAFRIPDLTRLDQTSAEFQKYWYDPGGEGTHLAAPETGGLAALSAYQYFGTLRDYLIVSGLFQSRGIRYSVNIADAKERTGNQKLSAEDGSDIHWIVDAYRFKASPTVSFYRFAAHASMSPLPLLFPDPGDVSPKIDVGVSFVKSPATIGLLQKSFRTLPGGMKVELSPAVEKKLNQIDESHSTSELGTTLKLVSGGVDFGSVIAKGLLGGTTTASIVSGGIIGNGKVSQVLGVNQELARIGNTRAGLLFAFEPGGDNSLFLGPSLQFSVFTLSVGFRAFEKSLADMSGKTTTTRVAGVLSLDLSRLTGSKSEKTQIQLENASTGGDIGKASDLISRDLALIRYTLSSSEPSVYLNLVQVFDGNDKPVGSDSAITLYLTPTEAGKPQMLFVPRGRYSISSPSDKLQLFAGGLPVARDKILILSGDSVANINWTLKKTP